MWSLHNANALPEATAKTTNAVPRLATCWMARVSDSSGVSDFLFSIGVQRDFLRPTQLPLCVLGLFPAGKMVGAWRLQPTPYRPRILSTGTAIPLLLLCATHGMKWGKFYKIRVVCYVTPCGLRQDIDVNLLWTIDNDLS